MRRFWTFGLLAVLGIGCEDTLHRWAIAFEDAGTASRAVRIEASIDREGCGGETIFETSITRDGLDGMQVPSLDSGAYGFRARALDTDCQVIAERCETLDVPRGEGTVSLFLATVPARDACDGNLCEDGLCSDTPRPDAGLPVGRAPEVLYPWSGVRTGTGLIAGDTTRLDHPQRPIVRWQSDGEPAASYLVEWVACDERELSACEFGSPDAQAVVAGTERAARLDSELPINGTPPLGRRYAFRVGACETPAGQSCVFAEPRYVDVGRVPGDLEGDGTSDLLVVWRRPGMDDQLIEPDAYDGSAGVAAWTERLAAPILEGGARVGDYDADGVGELVVDRGGADGLRFVDDYVDTGTIAVDARDVVALGDVDGDGYADFAAALADEVQVFYGGPTFDPARRSIARAPTGVSDFPMAIGAAGDRDGDGLADLAVVSRIGPDQARVEVLSLATRVGTPVGPSEVLATGEAGTPTTFEVSVAGGFDMDDDGRPEIAISMPLSRVVYVWTGDGSVVTTDPFVSSVALPVAMGQMDGTGRARVVVGEPEFERVVGRTGQIWHLRFSGGGLASTQVQFTVNAEQFGRDLALGDFEGTGYQGWGARGGTGGALHLGLFDGADVGGTASFMVATSGRFSGLIR